MPAETGLLVAGEVLLAAAIATAVASLRPGGDPRQGTWARASRWLAILAAVPLTLASLLLFYYFLVPELSVAYVWSFTSTLYPWWYRLAGFWGGQAGSLLLWAWLSAGLLAAAEWRRRREPGEAWPIARLLVLVMTLVLTLIVIDQTPFAPTRDAFLAASPQGNGISPLLLSPFMLIHPPVQFLGYAMASFPAGFAAAYLAKGADWVDDALWWVRRYWLVLTLAVGLGGLWAYYVLSFGGYWAWDPVETSNLIPWLILTVGVHALIFHRRRDQYENLAPFATLLTLATVWFATFVTRSGLWVSVHSFVVQSSTITDPVRRFATILSRSSLASQTLTVMFGVLAATGVLFLARFARRTPDENRLERGFYWGYAGFSMILLAVAVIDVHGFVRFGYEVGRMLWPAEPGLATALLGTVVVALPAFARLAAQSEDEVVEIESVADVVDDPTLALVSILLLFVAFTTTLLLLLLGINGVQAVVYDSRAPWIALPTALTLTVLFLYRRIGERRAVLLAAGTGLLGGALALVVDPPVLGAGVPILTVATGAGIAKILEALGVTGWPTREQWPGVLLLGSGLLGVAMWASPPSNLALGVVTVEPGFYASLAGLGLSIATLIGSVAALRNGYPAARWAGLTGVLALGWYVGAVLAVAGAVLGWRDETRDLSIRGHVKRAGTWVLHVGVVVLMIGYGTSTFFRTQHEWDQTDPVARGIPETWNGYEFTVLGSDGEDRLGQGFYSHVWTTVRIEHGGQHRDTGRMLMYWGTATGNYVPQVYVSRGLLRDVYLVPDGVHTDEHGWVMANGQTTRMTSDNVDQVAMRVLVMPGVNLLWTGYVMMLAGIGLSIAGRRT